MRSARGGARDDEERLLRTRQRRHGLLHTAMVGCARHDDAARCGAENGMGRPWSPGQWSRAAAVAATAAVGSVGEVGARAPPGGADVAGAREIAAPRLLPLPATPDFSPPEIAGRGVAYTHAHASPAASIERGGG